jgi:hypothetical protein
MPRASGAGRSDENDPHVWSGRALQEGFVDAAKKDPLQADVAKFVALYRARNYEAASVMAPALLDALRARTGEDNPTFIQILSYVVDCYGYARGARPQDMNLQIERRQAGAATRNCDLFWAIS